MTNIKKHFAITMLTSVGVVLVNFVTGVLVARTLNPSGRGEIASIGTWSQILGWACSFGFSESLVYLQSSRPNASKRLVGTSLASVLLFGTIGVIVSELVIPLAFKHQSRDTVHLAKMYMVTIYLGVLGNMLNGLVKGHQNFNFANFLRLFQPALYVVGILVFWFFHFLTPATTLTASAISGGVSAFLTLGSLLKSNGIGLPSLSLFKEGLVYGLKLQGALFGALANARLDIMIMPSVLAASQIGLYSVATNLASIIVTLLASLTLVIFPAATRAGGEQGMAMIAKSLRLVLIGGFLMATAFGIAAPFLLHFVYGGKFDGAAFPLRILLPGVVLVSGTEVLHSGLQSINKGSYASWAQLAGFFVTVIGLELSLRTFGIVGAAVTSTASYLACFITALVLLARTKQIDVVQTISSRAFAADVALYCARMRSMLAGASK